VRIERLWVDVTAQVGALWADHFTLLELHHGLDINNHSHIWLLHHLFLPTINQQLSFFAASWNQHVMQIHGGPNRSPADMFCFDMLVHGIRGDQVPPNDQMTDEELEAFGVDWEALQDDAVLASHCANNTSSEGLTSWVGTVGPPEDLNEVQLDPIDRPFMSDQLHTFEEALGPLIGSAADADIISLWFHGLTLARSLNGNMF
jgi:hypothetical protein